MYTLAESTPIIWYFQPVKYPRAVCVKRVPSFAEQLARPVETHRCHNKGEGVGTLASGEPRAGTVRYPPMHTTALHNTALPGPKCQACPGGNTWGCSKTRYNRMIVGKSRMCCTHEEGTDPKHMPLLRGKRCAYVISKNVGNKEGDGTWGDREISFSPFVK